MADFLHESQQLFEYSRALRRDFHRHPELGFQEVRTAGIVAKELNQLGLEVSTGVGKTGVVALLEGDQPGPVVLIRVDMDALPIQEETGAEYASTVSGVMHACGHDGHTAIGLTVARILGKQRSSLKGSVKLVFQPAEEGLGGAESMLADGVLTNPSPDVALSVHLWNEKPVGWVGATPGPVMAAADIFRIHLQGKGGHAAQPHFTADPVAAAAQIISALQTVVARNVAPLEAAVVSVTTLRAGDAFNVIPDTADLQGTIRTFKAEVRQRVVERFEQVVVGIAQAMGCQAEIELQSITPAVVNDPQLTALVQEVCGNVLPDSQVDATSMTMGSEDMAFMMQDIPGCYILVGSANAAKGLDAAHHHPRFDVDEESLTHAAALLSATAARLLS
ncbi:MAG: amidohydrolase [Anaerolineales bacterium]|jgi:amidohydrolase